MDNDSIGGNPHLPVFEAPEALTRGPSPEDPDGLSSAERAVVEAVADGLSPTAAGVAAGYGGKGAAVVGRPAVRSALLSALERRGVDDDRLARVLDKGLKARRSVFDKHGNLVAEVPDHLARHRYVNTVLQVRGDLKAVENNEETWEFALALVRGRRA